MRDIRASGAAVPETSGYGALATLLTEVGGKRGYQVMKKWLSYREHPLLGRDLKPDEVRYVTEMTRRIAAIVLLEPALDAKYERVKAATYAWPEA